MANEYTYRADHIGPLIVPAALSQARQRRASGEINDTELRETEDAAIKAAVDMQRAAGVAVISDGGFRRIDQDARLNGDRLAKHELPALRALTRKAIKVTVPAARAAAGETHDAALGRAALVKKEIEALIAAGVDYVQLDTYGYGDPNISVEKLLQIDTAAVSGINRPAHIRIGVHFAPPSGAQPRHSLSGIAERLFQALPVDRFILPLGDAGGGFELLRAVPKGKLVVLGLISAANPALEDIDDLMARIDRAAKIVDGDDLALSPAAGFGVANLISEADQRRKLELVAEVATRWWGFAM